MANRVTKTDLAQKVRTLNSWMLNDPEPQPDIPLSFHLYDDATGIGLNRVHTSGDGITRILYPATKRATYEKLTALLLGVQLTIENHHK